MYEARHSFQGTVVRTVGIIHIGPLFKTASSRTLSHAPRRVINPFNIPPHDGAINMIEKTTPSDCAQSGSDV